MKKVRSTYEPHLVLKRHSIAAKGEWTPRLDGLVFLQICQGDGYFLKANLNQELPAGTVIVMQGAAGGVIRASQLGACALVGFNVIPARLGGLLTLGEQRSLELALASKESDPQFFPPESPVAIRMTELVGQKNQDGLAFRLKLILLMAEIFDLNAEALPRTAKTIDASQRLEFFLKETPISDLLEMNFSDLAQMTNCTSRHLSRLFQKLVGMSFNDKRSELRLARALDLLATSHLKVVDVALESGFKSLSQFNQVFARQFGVTPGRWRAKNSRVSSMDSGKKFKNTRTFKGGNMILKLNASGKHAGRAPVVEMVVPNLG